MELPSIALRMFMKAARWSQLGKVQKHSEFLIQILQILKVIQFTGQREKQDFLHWKTNINPFSFILLLAGTHEPSSRWFRKDNQCERAVSPVLKQFISDSKTQTRSPRTVLDALEGQSNSTEDDTFSTRISSITDTPSMAPKSKRKSQSPFRRIASFLGSPLRRKSSNLSKNEKRRPLLKCFSYEEISNATNGFHQGTPFRAAIIVVFSVVFDMVSESL